MNKSSKTFTIQIFRFVLKTSASAWKPKKNAAPFNWIYIVVLSCEYVAHHSNTHFFKCNGWKPFCTVWKPGLLRARSGYYILCVMYNSKYSKGHFIVLLLLWIIIKNKNKCNINRYSLIKLLTKGKYTTEINAFCSLEFWHLFLSFLLSDHFVLRSLKLCIQHDVMFSNSSRITICYCFSTIICKRYWANTTEEEAGKVTSSISYNVKKF